MVLLCQGREDAQGQLLAARKQVQGELGHDFHADEQRGTQAVQKAEGPVSAGVVPGEAELVLLPAQDDTGDAVVHIRHVDDGIIHLCTPLQQAEAAGGIIEDGPAALLIGAIGASSAGTSCGAS